MFQVAGMMDDGPFQTTVLPLLRAPHFPAASRRQIVLAQEKLHVPRRGNSAPVTSTFRANAPNSVPFLALFEHLLRNQLILSDKC
jgi:hypothetical protein